MFASIPTSTLSATVSPWQTPADVRKRNQSYDEETDMAELKGQESVKRALEIPAAAGHNALILYPIPCKTANSGLPPSSDDHDLDLDCPKFQTCGGWFLGESVCAMREQNNNMRLCGTPF
jgi:hypothetical protein